MENSVLGEWKICQTLTKKSLDKTKKNKSVLLKILKIITRDNLYASVGFFGIMDNTYVAIHNVIFPI